MIGRNRYELLKTSNGVKLKQNEKALSDSIESSDTAGHDTNHVPKEENGLTFLLHNKM